MRTPMLESTVVLILLLSTSMVYGNGEGVLRPMSSKVRPSGFTANKGQWDEHAEYKASIPGGAVWLTEDGLTCQVSTAEPNTPDFESPTSVPVETAGHEVYQIKFSFENGSVMIPGELMTGKCNYILGNDPGRWHRDVPCYSTVAYEDLSGSFRIELKQLIRGLRMKAIFEANSDISKFGLRLEDVDWSMDSDKSLKINTDAGTRMLLEITSASCADDVHSVYECAWRESSKDCVTIGTRGEADGRSLVVNIDLLCSTTIHGSEGDYLTAIDNDSDGNVYAVGTTYSIDFPTSPGSYSDTGSICLVKYELSPDDSLAMVYSTLIGGVLGESGFTGNYGCDIAVDQYGNACITGMSSCIDYPVTSNAYGGHWYTPECFYDAVISYFNSEGNGLIYSTYYSGECLDMGMSVDIGSNGLIYVCGLTISDTLVPPWVSSYDQVYNGDWDGFVAIFDPNGLDSASLVAATYLGAGSLDQARGIVTDDSGYVYVYGFTHSWDYPITAQAFQGSLAGGDTDAFVTKLTADLSALSYSTFFGGSGNEHYSGNERKPLAIDGDGRVYFAAETNSTDLPLSPDAFQNSNAGGYDVFAACLSEDGDSLIYGTYIGGSSDEWCNGLALDDQQNIRLCGHTTSLDFPLLNPYQDYHGGTDLDIFLTKISSSFQIQYSTYFGYGSRERATDVVVDDNGTVFVCGYTGGYSAPTDDAMLWTFAESSYWCGDPDASGEVDIDDVVYLINYIFAGGSAPDPLESGDADCSGATDIDDVVYLISYIFSGGNAPGDPDGDGVPDC